MTEKARMFFHLNNYIAVFAFPLVHIADMFKQTNSNVTFKKRLSQWERLMMLLKALKMSSLFSTMPVKLIPQ